jgi:hypothetical protein
LYVPDRERKSWCSTHPIGFCDEWFKKIAEVLPTIRRPLFLNNRSSAVMMASAAAVEQMPEYLTIANLQLPSPSSDWNGHQNGHQTS